MGPVAIDLFYCLIRYEDTSAQCVFTFPARFAPIILPYTTRFAKMIGAKRPGKGTLTLHSGISVTDRIKINKQNKSVLLYVHSEFQAI